MLTTGEMLAALFYWALGTVLIFRLPLFRNTGISSTQLGGILLIKVTAGIIYGYIHHSMYDGGDTFAYYYDSLIVTSALRDHPLKFLHLVFGITHRPPDSDIAVYAYRMSYYTGMSSYFMVRLHALMNLFTYCHYYGNVAIYNFLTLIGQLFLFRFIMVFQPAKKNMVLILLFLFPSVVFWSSGMHKDGISIAAIGVILYYGYKLIRLISFTTVNGDASKNSEVKISEVSSEQRMSRLMQLTSAFCMLAFGLWILAVVRNYLLLLLLPGCCTFILVQYAPRYMLLKYLLIYTLFYFLLFQLGSLHESVNLSLQMAAKQQEFFQNPGGRTNIILPPMEPGITGLLCQVPVALYNCFFLPSLTGMSSALQIFPAIDNIVVIVMLVTALFFAFQQTDRRPMSLFLFCLFFAWSVFIFTGSIVPNIGALVRYKMPGTLFLLAGCIIVIDDKKIKQLMKRSSQ